MIKLSLGSSNEILSVIGLAKDAKNKNMVLYDMSHELAQSDHPQILESVKKIRLQMNAEIDDLVFSARPLKVELESSFELQCGLYFWENDLFKIKECAAKALLENETSYRYLGKASSLFPEIMIPSHFSKKSRASIVARREEIVKKSLTTTTLLHEPLRKVLTRMKRSLENHIEAVNISLKGSVDLWKKQRPGEFCRRYYLTPTVHIKHYLPEGTNEIQAMKTSCEEMQKKKNKRFMLSNEEIAQWVNDLLVKI